MEQHRYPEPLAAFSEASDRFTPSNEPMSAARNWHRVGLVYYRLRQPEAAEQAFLKSLTIAVQSGDVEGQARMLGELGNLYGHVLNRPEQAVVPYRQAIDIYVEGRDLANEGRTRCNLGMTLHKLGRLDDARQETHRAIECEAHLGHASEPWRTWNSLAEIEIDAGSPAAAADATRNAITGYLAFRREGGENHDADGRISLAVTRSLLGNDPAKAASLLEHFSATAAASGRLPFIQSLRAVVDGSRDRTLADAPSFFTERAEILLLIETLERASL